MKGLDLTSKKSANSVTPSKGPALLQRVAER